MLGSRSFGPILLVSGLFCVTPVGVVPGVPTMLALLVLLVSVQQVAGKDSPWLPSFLRNREIKTRRVAKSVQILRQGRLLELAPGLHPPLPPGRGEMEWYR